MELYILSVWKNHNSPKQWLYDICPMEQFFRNSVAYLTEYKEPYYYTPIFTGSHDLCNKIADELKTITYGANDPEELEKLIKGYLMALKVE